MLKTVPFTAILLSIVSLTAQAGEQRKVTALHFTAVSCGPCGAAAYAVERLKSEAGDTLSVIGVHYYDSYQIPEAESLAAHYSVAGTPTTWFDGVDVQYYADTATYWNYRNSFDKRKVIAPQARLSLSGWADTSENAGAVTCQVSNPGPETLAARLRLAIIERAIYRPWGGGDSVYDVLRDMLPGFDGPVLRLAPGADTSFTCGFSISPDWEAGRLEFMAWAESQGRGRAPGSGSIMQSERIGIGQLAGAGAGPPTGPVRGGPIEVSLYPNPVKGRGTLRFSMAKPGRAGAAFYDVAGRRLGAMDLGWRGAGEHRVVVDSGKWPAGAVFCVVRTNSRGLAIKATKLN